MTVMKKGFLPAVAALSLSAAASQLPFSDTFDALNSGSISGQNGWTDLSGTANIQSNVFASGSQAMEIQSGTVTHALSSSGTVVWVSFQARITSAPEADPVVTNANTSVAFFADTNLNLVAYSNQTPIRLNAVMQTNVWIRFDIFCDYNTLKWILSVNGTNVAENLSLYSTSSQIESLLIANDSASSLYFDELTILDTEPTNTVANIDTDSDGIPDWWELRYFGGITNALPNEAGLNGLTHLQTYIAGLDPDNASDLLTITKANGRKLGWNRKPGRQYDIYWASDLTSDFTYIYTAGGNEFEDTDDARTQSPSGFYQIRVRK